MVKTKHKFTAGVGDEKKRLDVFLSEKMDVSRSRIQKYIEAGGVTVDGKLPKKAGDMVREGQTVMAVEKEMEKIRTETKIETTTEPIRIIAEEKDYLVVHKPAGLLVHETQAGESDTLFSRLVKDYREIADIGESETRGGIVHRLDKEASGLLVVARTKKMFDSLKKQFQARTIEKEYTVLVHGRVIADHGEITFPIDRGRDGSMVARPKADLLTIHGVKNEQEGKEAKTEFSVVKRFARYTLLSVKIHTGRMHQIRVHMQAYGYPVVGDSLYFNKKLNRTLDKILNRLFLHATRLCFLDVKKDRQCFEDDLPSELQQILSTLV